MTSEVPPTESPETNNDNNQVENRQGCLRAALLAFLSIPRIIGTTIGTAIHQGFNYTMDRIERDNYRK